MEECSFQEKLDLIHANIFEILKERERKFIPGTTMILTGCGLYDHREVNAVIDSMLGGWLGLNKKGFQFESMLSECLSVRHSVLVNSGSSANLLALNAIKEQKELSSGEIITPASAYPTTINPILQLGFTPALIDVDTTLNITPDLVESAINENTVGIMFAHTMGNPARIDEICDIAMRHNLFVIEDCASALGAKYDKKVCGSFGDTSTFSFYAAHGITMGEGGAIATNDTALERIIRSLRDWGRDCYCKGKVSKNGACGKRFEYDLGGITYDHRYVYSHIGYNLKPIELQAAMGIEQLKKLEEFNSTRKRNFALYREAFSKFDKYFSLPDINEKADPVFFGLPIVLDDSIDRNNFVLYLNERKIATRLFFAGNILRQPAYRNTRMIVNGDLNYTNKLLRNCFWIGLHQGITEEMIDYVVSVFTEYFENKSRRVVCETGYPYPYRVSYGQPLVLSSQQ
jgi:CDP-6-deoxy-D-xylo-4-hexulose-3-dehydrase